MGKRGRHHLDGWAPRLAVAMSVVLLLMPTTPFAARLPAVAVVGVMSYLLGKRRVEREVEEMIQTAEGVTAQERDNIRKLGLRVVVDEPGERRP